MPLIKSQCNHNCSRVHALHVCVFCGSRVRCLLIERVLNAPRSWMNLLWNCSCNLAVSTDQLPALLGVLHGHVLHHSMDAHGWRLVHRALALADVAGWLEIARELRGHVCDVLESPHGNHVLQLVIELSRPPTISCVLCELSAHMASGSWVGHNDCGKR